MTIIRVFFFIRVEFIYNVLLVSDVQHTDSVIHIHTFIIFQVLFPYRFLQNTEQSSLCYIGGPCWLSIWYSVVCMLIPIFQFHQLSTPEEYSVVEDQKGFWRWWVGQVKQSIQLNLNFRQVSNKFFSVCPMHHWQYFLFAKPGNSGNCCCCSATKQLFATLWTSARQASLSLPISWSLLKLMSIKSTMPSSHLILSHPLLLLPSILLSIRSFLMRSLFALGGQSIGASSSVQYFQ